jgi:hypothetical protein
VNRCGADDSGAVGHRCSGDPPRPRVSCKQTPEASEIGAVPPTVPV